MNDPDRLLESPPDPALERDLRAWGSEAPPYDLAAGLERFRATLGGAPAGSNPEGTSVDGAPSGPPSTGSPASEGSLLPKASALPGSGSLTTSGALWFGGTVIGLAGALVALLATPSGTTKDLAAESRPTRTETANAPSPPPSEREGASLGNAARVLGSADITNVASPGPRKEAPPSPTSGLSDERSSPSPLPASGISPRTKRADSKEPPASAGPEVAPRSLAEELEELRRLRALVAHAPERVLTDVRSSSSGGALVPEREALLVEALVRLGRVDEARAKAGAFFRRYPQHPEGTRLRRLLPTP